MRCYKNTTRQSGEILGLANGQPDGPTDRPTDGPTDRRSETRLLWLAGGMMTSSTVTYENAVNSLVLSDGAWRSAEVDWLSR